MLLKQTFKTSEGASKRARFENAHCGGRYWYSTVRMFNGKRDLEQFSRERTYTYQLNKEPLK